MSYIVHLFGDVEEYEFFTQQAAEKFIEESDNGGEWIEIISLDILDPDLI